MLVKKFEAKTIKQAIEMVKTELGPEAIILAAKENDSGFGLMGQSSVEVTAAISESKFREKRDAERKLNDKARETYMRSSARTQKQFIQRAAETIAAAAAPTPTPKIKKPRTVTAKRYIDIDEEEAVMTTSGPEPRFEQAVSHAFQQVDSIPQTFQAAPVAPVAIANPTATQQQPQDVTALKREISYLKNLLEKFQTVPQNFISMHPGAEEGIPYELSFAYQKLMRAGLDKKHIIEALRRANETLNPEHKKKKAFVEGWLIKLFLEKISIAPKPTAARYHVFVGPTGQGKTSTVVKMASHLILNEKKRVAVLTSDTVKVGAADQLKIYAQILNIPFGLIQSEVDWPALDQKLKDFDVILIDTAGINLRGAGDIDIARRAIPKDLRHLVHIHYVQSIMARDEDAFDIADRFQLFKFNDVIFTRLDEAVQFGFIYNFSERYKVPVHSFGTGNEMPEGFETATKERIIDILFGLSKSQGERGQA